MECTINFPGAAFDALVQHFCHSFTPISSIVTPAQAQQESLTQPIPIYFLLSVLCSGECSGFLLQWRCSCMFPNEWCKNRIIISLLSVMIWEQDAPATCSTIAFFRSLLPSCWGLPCILTVPNLAPIYVEGMEGLLTLWCVCQPLVRISLADKWTDVKYDAADWPLPLNLLSSTSTH